VNVPSVLLGAAERISEGLITPVLRHLKTGQQGSAFPVSVTNFRPVVRLAKNQCFLWAIFSFLNLMRIARVVLFAFLSFTFQRPRVLILGRAYRSTKEGVCAYFLFLVSCVLHSTYKSAMELFSTSRHSPSVSTVG